MDLRISPAAAPAASSSAPTRSMLVVDDLPEICDVFRRIVRRMRDPNLRLVTEINSARALDLVASERFDVVVSDFRMREVSGIELLAAARAANPGGRRVLITGYNEIPEAIARIREAGVDAYLQKPLGDQDLRLLLDRLLANDPAALEQHRREARELEDAAEREERQVTPSRE